MFYAHNALLAVKYRALRNEGRAAGLDYMRNGLPRQAMSADDLAHRSDLALSECLGALLAGWRPLRNRFLAH